MPGPVGPSRVLSGTLRGLSASRVRVEADVAPALPGFSLVGLAGASLRESRERIGRALQNSGFRWPEGRITVSLAPADLRKEGAAMDLAIATAILLASGQLRRPEPELMRRTLFVAELALDGALRPARGIVAMALDATRLGATNVVCAEAQLDELEDVGPARIWGLRHLRQLAALLAGRPPRSARRAPRIVPAGSTVPGAEWSAVRGQDRARRAVLLAAAGAHHLMLQGPPGCGKTLLARGLAGMLPALQGRIALDRRRIHSCAGLGPLPPGDVRPPLRAPHHSTTAAGLVGGGRPVRPGEITLAHGGVLLLDEIAEFSRRALERLREPLSDGVVRIVRGDDSVEFPARFQLVATANPCPCGYYGSALDRCRCAPSAIERYRNRLSGPLRDRIDLWVEMDREPAERFWEEECAEPADVVGRAQEHRRSLPEADREDPAAAVMAALGDEERDFLSALGDRHGESLRGLTTVFRVARTIAGLEGRAQPGVDDLAEAFTFRPTG